MSLPSSRSSLSALVALVSLTGAACGSSQPTAQPPPDVPAAPRDASRDVAREASQDAAVDDVDLSVDDVQPCSMRPDASDVTCVLSVRGRTVDQAGARLASRVITYCSTTCFATTADTSGSFNVPVGDFINPTVYSLLVHGRPEYASLYVRSPAPVGQVVSFDLPVAVPAYVDMGPVIPDGTLGGSFTAGDVTLTIAPGTVIETDLEDALLGELGHRLRGVYVPMEQAPAFAREANVTALWALAPFNMLADHPIAVRVANRAHLAPGTAVEFVVLGQDILSVPPTAGRPLVAATGRVSSDGMYVATDPGTGISFVTWVGTRAMR